MKKLEDWIEYLEGEVSLKDRTEMNLLLKHSMADQLILDNLRRLRQCVRESDQARSEEKLLNDKQYHERIQSQIMREVRKIRFAERPNLTVVTPEENLSASVKGPSRLRDVYRS